MKLEVPEKYTFHSFRRTAATSAADAGSTSNHMTDFFGWKDPSMCQEYISISKPAIVNMAMKLAGNPTDFNLDDPEVEVEVAEEEEETVQKEPTGQKNVDVAVTGTSNTEEGATAQDVVSIDDCLFEMEEDPDLYVAAGLPIPPMPVRSANEPVNLESTIRSALSSVQNRGTGNVTVKFVIVTGGTNTINF